MSLPGAQALWRLAPEGVRKAAAPLITHGFQSYARARARRTPDQGGDGPIKVVGYFSGSHGISASARLCVRAFEALGAEVQRVDITPDRFDFRQRLAAPTAAAAWIFHLNAPELLLAMAQLGPDRLLGPRYGYWAWELPRAPASWLKDAAVVDEIWAPSRYTAQAMDGAAAPVRVVPHPFFAEDYANVAGAPRQAAFQAVTLFDFKSSMARKNPQGAIAAFARAFGHDPHARLTIKTQNGGDFPHLLAKLRAEAPANVAIVDEVWPYEAVKRLIAGADVLISLHRGEGFGLTMAEAMALGAPVMATAFSGNLDFMDGTCGLMVPSSQIPVVDPQGIYRGQTWADPDIEAAAEGLKRLRAEPGLRQRLVEAGRRRLAETLSPRAWFVTLPANVQAAARRAGAST